MDAAIFQGRTPIALPSPTRKLGFPSSRQRHHRSTPYSRFRNVLPLPYLLPYFRWTVVLAAACERSCSVCFALFLPLYAASAPVYSLLYGWGRSPQLHHGAVFSLLFKGERPRSFCDYILDSILRSGRRQSADGRPVILWRRTGDRQATVG